MAISETKGQGGELSLPMQYRKACSDILTSTLAAFLFSSHPKRERDQYRAIYFTDVFSIFFFLMVDFVALVAQTLMEQSSPKFQDW